MRPGSRLSCDMEQPDTAAPTLVPTYTNPPSTDDADEAALSIPSAQASSQSNTASITKITETTIRDATSMGAPQIANEDVESVDNDEDVDQNMESQSDSDKCVPFNGGDTDRIMWPSLSLAMKYHIFLNVREAFNTSAAYVLGLNAEEEEKILEDVETRKKQPMTCDQLWQFCLEQGNAGDLYIQPEVFERHCDLMVFVSHFDFALPLELESATQFLIEHHIDTAFLGIWQPDPVGSQYLKYIPEHLKDVSKIKISKPRLDPKWWDTVEDKSPLFPGVELESEVEYLQLDKLNEGLQTHTEVNSTDHVFGFPSDFGVADINQLGSSNQSAASAPCVAPVVKRKRGRPRKHPLPSNAPISVVEAREWLSSSRGESQKQRVLHLESATGNSGMISDEDEVTLGNDLRTAGDMRLRGRKSLKETEAMTAFRQISTVGPQSRYPSSGVIDGDYIEPRLTQYDSGHPFALDSPAQPTDNKTPYGTDKRSRHLVLKVNDKTGFARIESQYPTGDVTTSPPEIEEQSDNDDHEDLSLVTKRDMKKHHAHRSHITQYFSPVIRSIYYPFDEKNRVREQPLSATNRTDLFLVYGVHIWNDRLAEILLTKNSYFKVSLPSILQIPEDLDRFSAGLIELWNRWFQLSQDIRRNAADLIRDFPELSLLAAQWLHFSRAAASLKAAVASQDEVKKAGKMRAKAEECRGRLIVKGLDPERVAAWKKL